MVSNDCIQQLPRRIRCLICKWDKSTFRSSSSAFKGEQVSAGTQWGSDSPALSTTGGIILNTPIVSITNPAGPSPRRSSDSGLASPAAGALPASSQHTFPKPGKGIYDKTWTAEPFHPSLLETHNPHATWHPGGDVSHGTVGCNSVEEPPLCLQRARKEVKT